MSARKGIAHHKAKLTDDQVSEIRSLYQLWKEHHATKGYGYLAMIFQTSPWTIRDIVKQRTRA